MKTQRDKWIAYILVAIGALNFADYFLTLRALSFGIEEGNPYMDALIGTPWFPIVKLLLVPLGLYRIWTLRDGMGWISRSLLILALLAYSWVTGYHMAGMLYLMYRP